MPYYKMLAAYKAETIRFVNNICRYMKIIHKFMYTTCLWNKFYIKSLYLLKPICLYLATHMNFTKSDYNRYNGYFIQNLDKFNSICKVVNYERSAQYTQHSREFHTTCLHVNVYCRLDRKN